MFRGGAPNPYDEIVVKTTDENLTSENWELILNLCDKVNEEGEPGARNVIAAVLKRLAHRNPNVQLYALALSEALSKNCGIDLHRELASRSFTQGLERLITDRTTHERVRRKALGLIAMWTSEFEKDSTLGIMEECYNSLKAKNYSFEQPDEPPPPQVDDEVRRREEEELQRVLEMSLRDKGGRRDYDSYGAGSSSAPDASASSAVAIPSSSLAQQNASQAISTASYAESQSTSPVAQTYGNRVSSPITTPTRSATLPGVVTRVRALHTFQPTDKGELAFDKGDIIKVVDRNYKDWWRGQLKGRTGIFPVNYVEPLPEPTATEIAREAEQEALVFTQAANIDKLLSMLRGVDPSKDNLADNEEIQELYRQSMALRPKIVKLIDKYNQKRAELVMMNESFVKARTIFDRMMEDSLARHSGMYDRRPSYTQPVQLRPNAVPHPDYRASYAGPDQPGYAPFPQANVVYPAENSYQNPVPQTPYTDPSYANQPPPQAAYQRPYSTQPVAGMYGPAGQQPAIQRMQPPHIQGPVQPQPQPQPQPQSNGMSPSASAQSQSVPQQPQGPPYIFDPAATYADPNVQAWAQYYAKGGKDHAGAVYFVSVPGVTDGQATSAQFQQAQHYSDGTNAVVNTSTTSLPSQMDHNPTPAIPPQPQVQLSASQIMPQQPGSPNIQHRPSYVQRGSVDSFIPQQPVQEQSQAYPPNPYPAEQPGGFYRPGGQPLSGAPHDSGQYDSQFAQMHNQFNSVGLGDQHPPSGQGAIQAA